MTWLIIMAHTYCNY